VENNWLGRFLLGRGVEIGWGGVPKMQNYATGKQGLVSALQKDDKRYDLLGVPSVSHPKKVLVRKKRKEAQQRLEVWGAKVCQKRS